jgi:hypothetical protein
MAKDAFIIMPFAGTATCTEGQWTEIYENVFHSAFTAVGYSCDRAKPMTGALAGTIIDRLRTARIVLADLTDRNPNVFYELGIRHSLRKGTILVAQGSHHIPSDLKGYWFVDYGISPGSVTKFKTEIARLIPAIENEPEKSDNPVADYLDREKLSIYGHLQRDAIKKLGALLTELTGLRNLLGDLRQDWRNVVLLSCDCVKLLCNTMYVDVGPNLLKAAYELVYRINILQRQTSEDLPLVRETEVALDQFTQEISGVREMMIRGEFAEPTTISTMAWVPIPEPQRRSRRVMQDQSCYSWSQGISLFSSILCETVESAASDDAKPEGLIYRPPSRNRGALEPDRSAWRKPCPCESGRLFKNCCGRDLYNEPRPTP